MIPTEDGKQVFIEVIDEHRLDRSYFKNLNKEEYIKKYPLNIVDLELSKDAIRIDHEGIDYDI